MAETFAVISNDMNIILNYTVEKVFDFTDF